MTFGGEEVHYNYNKNQNVIAIKSPHYSQNLTYDSVGNLTNLEVNESLRTFKYDPLYQLIDETGPFAHTYLFDSTNTRLEKDCIKNINNDLHQLLNDGENAYKYDANGNCLSNGKHAFTYDALGRMIKAGPVAYTYDFNGRLMSRTESGEKEQFFYFKELELGSTKALRILANSISGIEINGIMHPTLCDYRNNLVLIQDRQNTVLTRYDYSAFGETIHTGTFQSPWQFSSKRFDPTTKLLHFPKRVYDPITGRWMTPDPIGFEDGLNLYAYVHNNPLIFIDPLGLSTNPLNYSMNRGKTFGKGVYNMFTDPVGTGYNNWARIGNMANTFYNKGFSGVYNDHMPKNFTERADFFCDQGGQFIGGAALVVSSVFTAVEAVPAAASAVLNTGRWIQRGVSLKNTWNRLSGSSKSHNKPAQNSPKNVFVGKNHNKTPSIKIDRIEADISTWLGDKTRMIYNDAHDPIFLSKDGFRRVRFDFKNSHGVDKHMHLEHKINKRWRDATSKHWIFPKKN